MAIDKGIACSSGFVYIGFEVVVKIAKFKEGQPWSKNDKLKQHQSLAIQLRQVVPSIQQLYHDQAAFLSTLNVQNVLSVDVQNNNGFKF